MKIWNWIKKWFKKEVVSRYDEACALVDESLDFFTSIDDKLRDAYALLQSKGDDLAKEIEEAKEKLADIDVQKEKAIKLKEKIKEFMD